MFALLDRREVHWRFDDAPVEEMDVPVVVTRVAGIVRDHADRRAALMQLAQQIHDGFAALRIEIPGGLVRQEDHGFTPDGPRDGHALLLSARELTGKVFRTVRHADALEGLSHPLAALRWP